MRSRLNVGAALAGLCACLPLILGAAERQTFTGGIVLPSADVVIRSKVRREIKRLTVREGDRVQQGAVVVELDNDLDQILLEQAKNQLVSTVAVDRAEAALQLAEVELKRQEDLGAQSLVSQRDVDRARVSLKIARIDLQGEKERKVKEGLDVQLRKEQLDDTLLKSPISGYIVRLFKHQGEMVEELENIIQVVDIDEVRVQFDLPAEDVQHLVLGAKAAIEVEATPGGPFEGLVTFIAPVVEPRSKTRRIKVTVKNPKHLIKPGLSASLTIEK